MSISYFHLSQYHVLKERCVLLMVPTALLDVSRLASAASGTLSVTNLSATQKAEWHAVDLVYMLMVRYSLATVDPH